MTNTFWGQHLKNLCRPCWYPNCKEHATVKVGVGKTSSKVGTCPKHRALLLKKLAARKKNRRVA